jgi:hypothetical protein
MASPRTAHRQVARLSFEDGEVHVTPKDRSLFLMSAEKATEACRDVIQREEGIERFESAFLVPLHQWCMDHADRVRACYIPLPVGHIQVFIVTASPEFDFDLAEAIATLELTLSRSGWRVGVTQLPSTDEETLATFFSLDGALEVYAEQRPTSQQGGE